MDKKTTARKIDRANRLAGILIDQNLAHEWFDVSFGSRDEAQEVLDAVVRLGLRGEIHPFKERVRVFRDPLGRAESEVVGEGFQIELIQGDGGFVSD